LHNNNATHVKFSHQRRRLKHRFDRWDQKTTSAFFIHFAYRSSEEPTMPTSIDSSLLQHCQQIVTSSVLTPEQKRHFLALEAENALPYPELSDDARSAG
jgi:hypothetical protein